MWPDGRACACTATWVLGVRSPVQSQTLKWLELYERIPYLDMLPLSTRQLASGETYRRVALGKPKLEALQLFIVLGNYLFFWLGFELSWFYTCNNRGGAAGITMNRTG